MDYITLFDNIPEGILVLDSEFRIEMFNRSAEKITGFSKDDVIGKRCSDLFQTALCNHDCPLLKAMVEGKKTVNYECTIFRSDGSRAPVRFCFSIITDESGKILNMVGSFRDVTEIRDLTRQVIEKDTIAFEEKVKLETILNSITEGVFTIGVDWRIESFNFSAEKITGFTAEEAIGKYCYEVFRSDMCEGDCAIAKALELGAPVTNCEVNITRKDGKKVPISVNANVLVNDEGEIVGAVETFRDLSEVKRLSDEIYEKYEFSNIIGKSKEMQRIFELIKYLAETDTTVLIQGESGTGKELIAKAIHYNSARRNKPFVAVNCSALTESILESELFGHVKGAFTGAISNKAGRFEIADGGTLFLDEIGEISPNIQVKLLRFLEEKEFERVGSTQTIKVDVRLVAATNRNLKKAMEEGKFRADLFYRLNVVPINVPPLRERKEDIPLLVRHFIGVFNKKTGKNIINISSRAMDLLLNYDWPGNVRELENAIEHAFVHCRSDTILPEHMPETILQAQAPIGDLVMLSDNPLKEAERQVILKVLQDVNWNQQKAVERLKLSRTTLWRKMQKYGITR